MTVLVDTSVWIEYFRNGNDFEKLDLLIDENLIIINDLILVELIPFLKIKKQNKIIKLLNNIKKLQINIKWDEIIEYHFRCLKNGLNGIGIPDLIIAQNALQNNCEICTIDNHFSLLKDIINIALCRPY